MESTKRSVIVRSSVAVYILSDNARGHFLYNMFTGGLKHPCHVIMSVQSNLYRVRLETVLCKFAEYSKNLTAAGVPNELFLSKGAIHAFYTCPGRLTCLVFRPLIYSFALNKNSL